MARLGGKSHVLYEERGQGMLHELLVAIHIGSSQDPAPIYEDKLTTVKGNT